MKCLLVLLVVPIVYGLVDNELNKPRKDKYVLQTQCEVLIQKQVNEEMHASLVYANMAAHFDHNSVGRKGFTKFFSENSVEEREHAHKFIDYLNRRGARFTTFDIKMPTKYMWNGALEAFRDALNLEKHVNNKLYHLHDVAASHCQDQHLMDFIEENYLDEQVESIDKLQRYISILSGMDTPMGEYLLDRQFSGEKVEL